MEYKNKKESKRVKHKSFEREKKWLNYGAQDQDLVKSMPKCMKAVTKCQGYADYIDVWKFKH